MKDVCGFLKPVVQEYKTHLFRWIHLKSSIDWIFQDVNTPQYALVRLLHHGPDPHMRTLFVVGDPDQAIYGWRGANAQNMEKRFLQDFKFCERVYLTNNYRYEIP